jgi:hypothetical protein
MTDWAVFYRFVVLALSISILIQFALFIALHPRGRLEWATTLFSLSMFAFFGTLAFWLNVPVALVRPTIYPPLVIAAVFAMLGSILFTVISLQEWNDRRH